MISLEQARIFYPPEQGSAHGFDHVVRVTALAERIAQAEGADGTVVRAAALLHDLTAMSPGRADHHITSAQRAREILLSMGHPAGEVECRYLMARALYEKKDYRESYAQLKTLLVLEDAAGNNKLVRDLLRKAKDLKKRIQREANIG